MGRRSSGPKAKKRKRVTVQLLKRVHAGEVTEPYAIMERLIETVHGHLQDAKVGIAYRLGWRADTDGHMRLGQCRKRGDLDRELDGFDFIILLNKEAWPGLNEKQKAALVDHELCHAQLSYDADGQPKRNDRDRLVCRIKKHDTEEFRAVVDRHGLWTADLEQIARAAINDAKRPLLAVAERADGDGKTTKTPAGDAAAKQPGGDDDKTADKAADKDGWRRMKIAALELPDAVDQFVIDAGKKTLGALADYMADKGDFWDRDLTVGGQRKPPNFRAKIEDAWEEFWASHPEFTSTAS